MSDATKERKPCPFCGWPDPAGSKCHEFETCEPFKEACVLLSSDESVTREELLAKRRAIEEAIFWFKANE